MNPFCRLAALFVAVCGSAAAAFAQDYPVTIKSAEAQPAPVPAGATVSLRVEVEIDPAFHIYSIEKTENGIATSFVAPKSGWPAGLTAGTPTESPAAEKHGSGDHEAFIHRGNVSFTLPFTVAADAAPGARDLTGELRVQACDESSCREVANLPFTVKFFVAEPSTVRVTRTEFVPGSAAAGSDATIEVEFSIEKGWHLYAQRQEQEMPPKFKWTLPPGWAPSGAIVEVTPPHEAKLYGLDEAYWIHEGKLVLRQAFRVPSGEKTGKAQVKGLGGWQRCNELGCTQDADVPVAATVEVVAAGSVPAAAPVNPVVPPAPKAADPAPGVPDKSTSDDSLGAVLGNGLLFGFLTILTPCVFPLLPVTVSFFSKQKGPPLPRSLVYAAGIIFTITVIGLVFKSSLDFFARGSLFNAAVGLLFIALSLSLFGLFELRLPSFLIDKSQEQGASGGMLGAFFMAVTLALTSFSCSVPFLAIMFARFEKGDVGLSILGLLAYSATVALPFFLCSLFPALLKTLPKSGGWLNAVKVTMGFVELGLAFKFLRTVALNEGSELLPRSLLLALWTACALGAALYLFGYVTLPHDTKVESIGVVRLMFALIFLTMACYFLPGTFGRPLSATLDGFIQTQDEEIVAAAGGRAAEEAKWGLNDWDGALARAAEKRRPALFDFTGVG